jgi:hypothetical protein
MMRISIENRRKQLAQCIWLRQRVDEHLARGDKPGGAGRFQRRPGLDEFEKLFGRSGVEIVLGTGDVDPAMRLYDPHAHGAAVEGRPHAHDRPLLPRPAEMLFRGAARFHHGLAGSGRPAAGLADLASLQRPLVMAVPELREALLQASDHFPVTLDIPLAAAAV